MTLLKNFSFTWIFDGVNNFENAFAERDNDIWNPLFSLATGKGQLFEKSDASSAAIFAIRTFLFHLVPSFVFFPGWKSAVRFF